MIEAVKWTVRDGHLIAVHIAHISDGPPHLGVLTVDGWVDAEHPFPLTDAARPGYHFAVANDHEAIEVLEAAGVDMPTAIRRDL